MIAKITSAPFGHLASGDVVMEWTLVNRNGIRVDIIEYGAAIRQLLLPDRHGSLADVVLGFDSLAEYVAHDAYFGAIIGRYANRIRGGRFVLDGQSRQLSVNEGETHLHGGAAGFDRVRWRGTPAEGATSCSVEMTHVSPDGDQGYPGTVAVGARYTLRDDDSLTLELRASTDQPTIINLTQHNYFNLAGHDSGSVLDHRLQIDASGYLPIDDALLPLGAVEAVGGTPFDFRHSRRIAPGPAGAHEQLRVAGGYDHTWVLDRAGHPGAPAVALLDPASGRLLRVRTDEPGVQFYSGNFLDGVNGKGGVVYRKHGAVCLEPQHFPDSPNHPEFPSTTLRPGGEYQTATTFHFGVG